MTTSTPSVEIWPCDQCGNPGVRNVGNQGHCAVHLADLYALFDPSSFAYGVGLLSGLVRPEFGPLIADLTCCRCGATWAGIPGDPCWWCQRHTEQDLMYQADLLLRAPDVDPDDTTYDPRMLAWLQRMKRGVEAEIITRRQAELAWQRYHTKAAA